MADENVVRFEKKRTMDQASEVGLRITSHGATLRYMIEGVDDSKDSRELVARLLERVAVDLVGGGRS